MSGRARGDKVSETGSSVEDEVDTAMDDSFPASDPPSFTPGTGTASSEEKGAEPAHAPERQATGAPTDGRHETETAAGRVQGTAPPEHKED